MIFRLVGMHNMQYAMRGRSALVFGGILFAATIMAGSSFPPPAASQSYVPAPPQGIDRGHQNVSYTFTIFTTSTSSQWQFDWGDGSASPWLRVAAGEDRIEQSHAWTKTGTYAVRCQFKGPYSSGSWSEATLVAIVPSTAADYPQTPRLLYGTVQGSPATAYQYAACAEDPYGSALQYRFRFSNETSNWTALSTDRVEVTAHTWPEEGIMSLQVQARNIHGLTTEWSTNTTVTIGPGLPRIDYLFLGGVTGQLTFAPESSPRFSCASLPRPTQTTCLHGDTYLIDNDDSGTWDYVYAPAKGQLLPYASFLVTTPATLDIPWWLVGVLALVVGVLVAVFVLFKTGVLYVYEEDVEE